MSNEPNLNDLPELTDEELAMMNSMPKDLVDRLWHLQDRVNDALARTETDGASVDELTRRVISSSEKLQGITFGIVREAVHKWRFPNDAVSGQ